MEEETGFCATCQDQVVRDEEGACVFCSNPVMEFGDYIDSLTDRNR